MRCKNNCGNMTKTPARVESYKKWGICRPCAIKEGKIKPVGRAIGFGKDVRKIKGLRWRLGQKHAYKQPHKPKLLPTKFLEYGTI